MRFFLAALAVIALALPASTAGERTMAGWFNVTTPDGWTGKRYVDGSVVFAEEFDSNGDGRIDVWRFYRKGILSSEEMALGGKRIDFQRKWEPRERRLLHVLRDTGDRGVNDLEVVAVSPRRWEISEDRNHDGVADRILTVNAPSDLFERLGMDLKTQESVIDNIPPEYWYELALDDGYTGSITEYRRYSRGIQTHEGDWDGKKVAWRRYNPDAPAPAPASPGRGVAPVAEPGDPFAAPPAVADGGGAATDWTGGGTTSPQPSYGDPFNDPFAGSSGDMYQEPQYVPGPPQSATDRTRYEGMPPGDSAARSLPARMRPPGATRR